MEIKHFGYACINTELNSQDPRVSSSRTIRKTTYEADGLTKVGSLALQNARDLLTILKWNESNNIKFFRISSDILPWKSRWTFSDIEPVLRHELFDAFKDVGDYAKQYGHRLTLHPGPYNKLCSTNSKILENTFKELNDHNAIFDLMGFDPSFDNKINIHIGGAYRNKENTAKTWVKNYKLLPESLKKRLTVENDDRASLYDIHDLHSMIYQEVGAPLVFDFHHHRLHNLHPTISEQDAANLAISTWPDGVTPVMHWSESRKIEHSDDSLNPSQHSDLCYGPLPEYSLCKPIDLMIEAKKQEQALFTLIQNE